MDTIRAVMDGLAINHRHSIVQVKPGHANPVNGPVFMSSINQPDRTDSGA